MDKYSLTLCNDKNIWNDFVSTSPQGNIFCSTHFLEAWEQDYELIIVKQNERILVGAVMVQESPFIYQGILFDKCIENFVSHKRVKKSLDLIKFLLKELESSYERMSFSLHYSYPDLRGFQWFNYHEPEKGRFSIEINYTGLLNLIKNEDFDNILKKARSVRRQEYRRCKKEGFIIEDSDDVAVLDKLHQLTFERQGIKRSTNDKFMTTKFAKSAISIGFGNILICRDKQGNPTSASVFLHDDKCGYYIIGANDPEFRKHGTGSYILFEQIRRCKELGLSKIDFVGINSPYRGDFKTSFNAVPVPYYTVTLGKTEHNVQ